MIDAAGNELGSKTFQGNNFANMADETVQCEGSVGGWQDGYYNIRLEIDYNQDMGDVTAKIVNTLDQGAGDESIGIGNMKLMYEFNDGRPVSEGDYDDGLENPTGLWSTNCGPTEKTCQMNHYRGGHGECAQGHQFWRTFKARKIHPGTHTVVLTGKVWTIDSWDGEHFTVEMTDANGHVLDTVTKQGNNFASLGDETL
jgi:hypothetical protein